MQLLDKDGPDKLDAIKDNNPKDVETCCTEMFRHWTKNKTDASWKTLIAALKTIGFAVLADEIKRVYIMYIALIIIWIIKCESPHSIIHTQILTVFIPSMLCCWN